MCDRYISISKLLNISNDILLDILGFQHSIIYLDVLCSKYYRFWNIYVQESLAGAACRRRPNTIWWTTWCPVMKPGTIYLVWQITEHIEWYFIWHFRYLKCYIIYNGSFLQTLSVLDTYVQKSCAVDS